MDDLSAIDREPGLFDKADEVHISTLFTWDKERAEYLAGQWEHIAPVKVGGPAFGSAGEDFVPGMYVKPGYVITSRGCPNKCWFCSVWRHEGRKIRELPIVQGYNILDSNLLACSEIHISAVFGMLRGQQKPAEFSGGFEAKRFRPWHIDLLLSIKLNQVWFAYDEDDDLEPLVEAGRMLQEAGINRNKIRCYVLVGYPKDSFNAADRRLRTAYAGGFLPMAMLYRNEKGNTEYKWQRFQRCWARPAIIKRMMKDAREARI